VLATQLLVAGEMKIGAPRTLRAVPFNLVLNLRRVDRRPAKRTRRALTVSTVNPALTPGRQVPGLHAMRDCAVFFFVVLGHRLPGVGRLRPLEAITMPEPQAQPPGLGLQLAARTE